MAHSEDAMYRLIETEQGIFLADTDGNLVPFQQACYVESDFIESHAKATVTLIVKTESNES